MGKTRDTGFLNDCVFTDSSNNVGIGGAANASYKFAVTGNTLSTGTAFDFYTSSGLGTSGASGLLRVVTAGTSDGVVIGQSNNARYVGIGANQFKIYSDDYAFLNTSNNPLYFGTNNLTRLSIAAAGNINIETNNVALTQKNAAGTGTIGLLRLGSDNKIQIGDGGTANPSVIYFPNGNVGIGTSSPTDLLHLYKSGTVYQVIQTVSGGAGTIYRRSNSTTTDWYIGHGAASANENFEVYTAGTGAFTWTMNGSERMRITSGGNVGIGTTSPSYKLTVTDSTNNYVFQSDNQRNVSGIVNALITNQNNTNDTSSYFLVCSIPAGDRLYIYGNGNVVNKNNSYGVLSDIRLKENIIDATPKLSDLLQLKVRNYNLIEDEKKNKLIGFIAQEFEEVFPNMIDIDGKSGMKTIKTSVLVPMLVKAIQEQQDIINDLKDILKRNNLS